MSKLRPGGAGPKSAAALGAMLQDAMRCHQDGRTARAERLYRDILALTPDHLDATHLLGVLAAQRKDYGRAVTYIERALKIAPQFAQIHANLGKAYYGVGRIDEARATLEEAVRLEPGMADAWNDLGNAQRDLGRMDQAMHSFSEAVRLAPGLPEPWANGADVLIDVADYDKALSSLDRAIGLHPHFAEAFNLRARLWLVRDEPAKALVEVDQALAIRPRFGEALAIRADALHRLGRSEDAAQARAQALAEDPDLIDRLMAKAVVASGQWLRAAAISYCDRALALKPDHVQATALRSVELMLTNRLDEATDAAERALALDADEGLAHYVLGQIALQSCDWDRQADALTYLRGLVSAQQSSVALSAFAFMCFDTTPAEQRACAALSARQIEATVTQVPVRGPRRAGRIRLAYLSGDFHNHATAWLMAGLIERHDRDRFELIGLSNGPALYDAMRKRMAASFDHFIDVREMTDAAVVELIGQHDVDILVDLKGYTQGHRATVMAQRPAPVQVSFLGYPGTMGSNFIDYLIADPHVTPVGEDAAYSEHLVRLPHSYQVNTPRPTAAEAPSRASQGLPAAGFVFCGFNATYKITRPVFDVWMRLLIATPGSVLWLLGDNDRAIATLKREAQARGMDPERLIFAARADQAEHMARQTLADLFLDTCPVNAHTTASDALWAGLPVVTCQGPAFIGRVAASVLAAADAPELITTSLAEYEALVLSLVADRPRLAAIRSRLVEGRDTNALFDTDRFRRHIESAFETMHQRRLDGLAPEAFTVPELT